MIALDTNVLVRLLTGDNARQAEVARRLFDANADQDGALFVSDVVVAELAWVLRTSYAIEGSRIADAWRELLANATLRWQSPAAIASAIEMLDAHPRADLADCLIVALGTAHGCDALATFDRAMKTLPSVQII